MVKEAKEPSRKSQRTKTTSTKENIEQEQPKKPAPQKKAKKQAPPKKKQTKNKEDPPPKKDVPPKSKSKQTRQSASTTKTINNLLLTLGILDINVTFAGCEGLDDEFNRIKKSYHRKILQVHPDKGGNAADFRDVQSAFEVLRSMYEKRTITSFIGSISNETTNEYAEAKTSFKDKPVPSYEYYEQASYDSAPTYRMEPARSGRSECKQKGAACKHGTDKFIPLGEIRIGSLMEETGTYSRWVHLNCWRVPSKIWLGLNEPLVADEVSNALAGMNEVLMSGFNELSEEQKSLVVSYVMNKDNWAKFVNKKPKNVEEPQQQQQQHQPFQQSDSNQGNDSKTFSDQLNAVTINTSSTSLVMKAKQSFELRPGVNGAAHGALNNKKFVLTGVFPEIGGGSGLSLGKDRLKAIIESFGGKVTGSISGKTDYLISGKEPGASKFNAAEAKGVQIITVADLKLSIESGVKDLDQIAFETPNVSSFSAGYRGNAVKRITNTNTNTNTEEDINPMKKIKNIIDVDSMGYP